MKGTRHTQTLPLIVAAFTLMILIHLALGGAIVLIVPPLLSTPTKPGNFTKPITNPRIFQSSVSLISRRVARRRLVSLYLQQLGTMPFLADHLLTSFFLHPSIFNLQQVRTMRCCAPCLLSFLLHHPSIWLTRRIECAFVTEAPSRPRALHHSRRRESFMRSIEAWKP